MKFIFWALFGYLAFALQGTLAPELMLGSSTPQFLALVLVAAALRLADVPGLFYAALLGLLSDALAPCGLGIDVICFTLVAWGIQRVPWRQSLRAPLVVCLIQFGCIFLICVASTSLRALAAGVDPEWSSVLDMASGSAAMTALCAAGLAIGMEILWNLGPQMLGFSSHS